MAYRLDINKRIEPEIHRVVLQQIDRTLAEISDEKLSQAETVHQVRKRCKKIRAVLRLVRASLVDPHTYKSENAYFRDAARNLSELRDAEILVETYDKIVGNKDKDAGNQRFGNIRKHLVAHRDQIARQNHKTETKLREFYQSIRQARQRVNSWHLKKECFDAVESGLAKTYRRGRRAMFRAFQEISPENFHELRKRVKYHWYHCRLLRDIYKPIMKARIGQLDKLGKRLGDYHDIDVLKEHLQSNQNPPIAEHKMHEFFELSDRSQKKIRSQAHTKTKMLFAETPENLCRRFECYWNAGKPVNKTGL